MGERVALEQHIGIDFDNTIVRYDEAFLRVAKAWGLLPQEFPPSSKRTVRDAIRATGPDGNWEWTKLQAYVYGPGILEATPFDGVLAFLRDARERGIRISIVSHKTQFAAADPQGADLREAAWRWLREMGVSGSPGDPVDVENVFFESTLEEKLQRISREGCTVFIDDLEDVLAHPQFPDSVTRVLFAADGEQPNGIAAYARWDDLHRNVVSWMEAKRLLKRGVEGVDWVGGGGNSAVFRIHSGGERFALKQYARDDSSPSRLDREYGAFALLHKHGLARWVPTPVASDREGNQAIYEWVDGSSVQCVDDAVISQVLEFIGGLEALTRQVSGTETGAAVEAVFCLGDLLGHIERRMAALSAVSGEKATELHAFMSDEFEPAYARVKSLALAERAANEALPATAAILSPSDFSSHNMIARRDGSLVMLDFEYFGVDDPVKLACDFLWHPAHDLDERARVHFVRGFKQLFVRDGDVAARLACYFPLIGLKWALIVLNEFLPAAWERRRRAGKDGERREILLHQLARAQAFVAAVAQKSACTELT